MIFSDIDELLSSGIIRLVAGRIDIPDFEQFQTKMVDNLVDTLILSNSHELKKVCQWVIYEAAQRFDINLCSIQGLYEASARDNLFPFTVPAINIRTLTYDIARAVFRAAKKINGGAFIFEIAKSEIGYTAQRPRNYASLIMLAALREGYFAPIFLQGDHFQVQADKYFTNKDQEYSQLKTLIQEAVDSGFYNIDIDSSTLVDLSHSDIALQQRLNYEVCADFTKFIRRIQPQGIMISIGGEIGEVGGKNSTTEEIHAFMTGYLREISDLTGISKISIQTGTTHGGVVLADGSIANVKIDFDTLRNLSHLARKVYGMAGAVQHGASTLPNDAFHHFPEVRCAEIHLATQFQNIVYEYLPIPLKEKIYNWLHVNCAQDRQQGQTEDQFIYKTRKKALGPFIREIYSLPRDLKHKISKALEEEFLFLFDKLNVKDTLPLVLEYVRPIKIEKSKEEFLGKEKNGGVLEGAE